VLARPRLPPHASSPGQQSTVPPLSATPLAGQHILDIACGNGLTSRRPFGADCPFRALRSRSALPYNPLRKFLSVQIPPDGFPDQ
jgi:hypothetical protein